MSIPVYPTRGTANWDVPLQAYLNDAFAPRAARTAHAPAFNLFFPEAAGDLVSAISAAAPTNGVVDLAANTNYDLPTLLTVPAGVRIQGRDGATIKLSGTARAVGIRFTGKASMSGVTVDLQQIVTSYGIQIQGAGSLISDCVITHGNGVATSGVGIKIEAQCDIIRNKFSNIATPIQVTGETPDVTIDLNEIRDWTGRGMYILGTSTAAASNLTITRNRIYPLSIAALSTQPRQPITFQGDDNHPFTAVKVNYNIVRSPGVSHDPTAAQLTASGGQYGTADNISLHQCDGFELIGNHSYDGGDVGIVAAVQCRNGVVAGNVCLRNDSAGICVGSSNSSWTRDVSITGNTCMNNGQNRAADGPDWASNGINLQVCDGVIVEGNRCGDTQATKTQQYGMAIQNSPDVTIGTNKLGGNAADEIYTGTGTSANTTLVFNIPPARDTLTADQTVNNSATLVNTALALPTVAAGVYELEAYLVWNATATGKIKFKFNHPSGSTALDWVANGPGSSASSASAVIDRTPRTIGSAPTLGGPDASNVSANPKGLLTVGTAGGNLTVQFAQATAEASDCILRAGSWLKLTRIG